MIDDDDDDGDLSRFLLGLATSHAALGGSWVLDGIAPADNPLLACISHLYNMQENTTVQFDSLRTAGDTIEFK